MLKIIRVTNGEEWANTLTHGLGVLISYIGFFLLILKSIKTGDFTKLTSSSVFAGSAIILFSASTTYHIIRRGKWKEIFQKIDHMAIYLLIAGTYTPITLVLLKDFGGISIFYIVWIFSALGILYKVFFFSTNQLLSLVFYIGLGWSILLKIDVLIWQLPLPVMFWLILGGVFYTIGVIFFVWKKLKFHHAIWHLFVMAGCFCHFYLVYHYVIN